VSLRVVPLEPTVEDEAAFDEMKSSIGGGYVTAFEKLADYLARSQ